MNLSFKKFKRAKAVDTVAFGLDISDKSIKIAQLKQGKSSLILEAWHEMPLPNGAIVDGEFKDVTSVTNTLREAITQKKVHLRSNVVASLPEAKTFLQTIQVPKKDELTFEERIVDTLPEYLPFDLDEVYFDTIIISENDAGWTALVGAAPKQTVDVYLQILDAVNLLPFVLDLEMAALANAVVPKTDDTPKPRAIIDLGSYKSSLMVHDYQSIQFTSDLDIAGDKITKEISQQLELSIEDAEKAKRSCGLNPDKCEGVLRTILEKQVAEATKQVAAANEYYRTHFSYGRPIEEIILCGGGAHLEQLDKILANATNVPVTIGNPWQACSIDAPTNNIDMGMAVAIGLALRGLK